ncbi:tetratricopeptide repeat protein [Prosthecobacter sp.]|uniref:peptidase MA family metallohydrolase n=1 Tax=Prosthecobacter sp. TaxID=1965333 RepID=UPI00248971E7|nr:tetratricopeptide repeat protein [Prosthecobacter sp.]MDI1312224.1 peptidase MA family metallohydrolase [Prosthecobacter sp.]
MRLLSFFLLLLGISISNAQQIDLEKIFEEKNLGPVGELLAHGDYELVARIGEAAATKGLKSPDWRILRFKALREMGHIEQALEEAGKALVVFPGHFEILLLRHDLAQMLGRADVAAAALKGLNDAAKTKPAKDRTAMESVMLGRAAVLLGADAQKVITQYFKLAQSKDAKLEAAYLAEGNLALDKDDAQRAADVFRAGLKAHGETADLRLGLAKAFQSSDREKAGENLKQALELNPHLAAAHLLRAEQLIGGEKFIEAEAAIQQVLDQDENHPVAWALRAVVAYLFQADAGKMEDARQHALERWAKNPEVDHTIGRCISRAYRFAESAARQRQALEFDPKYLPAKMQLCNDLLRLGEEEEAWKVADMIRKEDGYNIQAHNLAKLEKEMNGYTTQTFDDFILKMPKREWPIYGARALALLRDAKTVLGAKYGMNLKRPVLVEFFGAQQDFAIRTFGALGGQGMLGVCFGTVVTMNSPGSLAQGRNNWESTLWHEFCHVITLTVTNNRMPRWLSEGISVHEERQRDPAWGMWMSERYRGMVLDEETLTPMSRLSSAFMAPKTQHHLLFAYYESSQAVEFLLEKFGQDKFQGILHDLANGKRINDAIAANVGSIEEIEKQFAQYIIAKAKSFGAKADWNEPKPEDLNPFDAGSFTEFLKKHPNNLWALRKQTETRVEAKKWSEVLPLADKLIELLPDSYDEDSGYALKVQALRQLKHTDEETAVLRQIAAKSSSAQSSFLRLIELDLPAKRWPEVKANAQRSMALNPFLVTPQRALAAASAALKETPEAIAAYERVLILDPGSAQTHFKLAELLRPSDATQAKQHLLDSLALAPRNREGLALLAEWK